MNLKDARNRKRLSTLTGRAFRGYPIATLAFYGPTDRLATKMVVAIVVAEGAEPEPMRRWFASEGDPWSPPTSRRAA
jgi:hypothetical protein